MEPTVLVLSREELFTSLAGIIRPDFPLPHGRGRAEIFLPLGNTHDRIEILPRVDGQFQVTYFPKVTA